VERVGIWMLGEDGQGSLGRRLAEVRALERWPELIGAQLANRTRAVQLAGDQLVVVANGAALRQELTFHKDVILRKFNEAAGRRVARRILFLESDAQLSSLLGREEAVAPAPPRTHEPDNRADAAVDAPLHPAGPAYEHFDAERYRRELSRLA